MKQTAVEWLIEEYFGSIKNCTPDFRKKIEQSKEMEKEQIIKAYKEGSKEGVRYYIDTEWGDDTKHIRGDEFYKNTYEKE